MRRKPPSAMQIYQVPQNGNGRVPPSAVDVEAQILGAMLIENSCVDLVTQLIDEDSFHGGGQSCHGRIFRAILSLREKNQPVDLLTLAEELRKSGHLEVIGGETYLADLTMKVTSACNVEYHAKIVLEKALARSLITSSSAIAQRAYSPTEDIFDLIDEGEQAIGEISERRFRAKKKSIGMIDLMHDSMNRLEALYRQKQSITGVPSGLDALDNLTAGWQDEDMIIVAGRPGSGKSALVFASAMKSGVPTQIFSAEMGARSLGLMRLLSMQSRIDSFKIRKGRLTETEWTIAGRAAQDIAKLPIWIDDTASPTVQYIRSAARHEKKKRGIKLIIIDYLQLCRGGEARFDSREQEVAFMSRSFKALAKELGIPVIVLAQLNRKSEDRSDKRPMLSDLRESGQIEQDSDVVCLVHRPEMFLTQEDSGYYDWLDKAEIIVAKQRNGPIDTATVGFLKQCALFHNLHDTKRLNEPTQENIF